MQQSHIPSPPPPVAPVDSPSSPPATPPVFPFATAPPPSATSLSSTKHLTPSPSSPLSCPGLSRFISPVPLLLFRLSLCAMLISHLVFFSLSGLFSLHRYSVWTYIGLTFLSLCLVFFALLELLRLPEPYAEFDEEAAHYAGASSAPQPPPYSPLVKNLSVIVSVLYQTFVSAAVFWTVAYWSVLHSAEDSDFSYALLARNVVAPAAFLLDLVLTMTIRFRIRYVPVFLVYNAAYGAAMYAWGRADGSWEYAWLTGLSTGGLIGRLGGLFGGSILVALGLCGITRFGVKVGQKQKSDKGEDMTEGSSEEEDMSEDGGKTKRVSESSDDSENSAKKNEASKDLDSEEAKEVKNTEDLEELFGGTEAGERRSLPIFRTSKSVKTHERRRSLGRARSSKWETEGSENSLGDAKSSVMSVWDELDVEGMHAKKEEEYFTMPAAYTGGEEEKVKLTPPKLQTSGSGRSVGLVRDGSWRLSRSGSRGMSRRLSRSGSGNSGE